MNNTEHKHGYERVCAADCSRKIKHSDYPPIGQSLNLREAAAKD